MTQKDYQKSETTIYDTMAADEELAANAGGENMAVYSDEREVAIGFASFLAACRIGAVKGRLRSATSS
ncbi:unnamed protein product [Haemonchus placei]|uniref:Acyl-CoA synthetase n=1 Tax=Haemonchus placei TaxID=6290 RepID=A0A0N4W3J9_HAEPC|nr:unnamed protein product [Haemonchus placei]